MSEHAEIYKEAKERMPSTKEKVKAILIDNGENGATNIELAKVSIRFGDAIYRLKMDGYDIVIKNLGGGVVNYTIKSKTVERPKYEKGIDVLIREINETLSGRVTSDELKALLDKNHLNIVRKPNGLHKIV